MKNTGTLKVTMPSDREVVMTRIFNAPRPMVFDAFTKPELLQRWFGPRGWSLAVCEGDFKVGGWWRFVLRGPDGTEMGMRGAIRELVRPERVVHAESFDDYPGESLVSTHFSEQDGKTTVTITVRYESKQIRDAVVASGMEHGAAECYDKLAEYLETASPSGVTRQSHPGTTGQEDRWTAPTGILNLRGRNTMQKITPFLWYNGQAEEAMNFYVSIFKNSKIGRVSRYGDAGPGAKGTVMSATFQLDGQEFMALNGGPQFTFSPAISFFVSCETQDEVDDLWEKLSAGGRRDRCGWLQDKYGVSWQIIPSVLGRLLSDKDAEKSQRVMKAMLQMDKLDIKRLQEA